MTTLRQFLEIKRESLGMNHKEFAAYLGVCYPTYHRLKQTGFNSSSNKVLNIIKSKFGSEIDNLSADAVPSGIYSLQARANIIHEHEANLSSCLKYLESLMEKTNKLSDDGLMGVIKSEAGYRLSASISALKEIQSIEELLKK